MMSMPGAIPPLPAGLHWLQIESGEWIPIEVADGRVHRLARVGEGLASGECVGSTMGPLVRPGGGA